jgi:transcriptional regulator with XRE-family HTH domain
MGREGGVRLNLADNDALQANRLSFDDWSWEGTRLTHDDRCPSLRGWNASRVTQDLARKTLSYYLAHYIIHDFVSAVLTSYSADIGSEGRIITVPCQALGHAGEGSLGSLGKQLALIQSTFGLKTSELARVLQVSRQTVYSWVSGRAAPQSRHRQRLETLRRITERASAFGGIRPGRLFSGASTHRGVLLGALGAEQLSEVGIEDLLRRARAEGVHGKIRSITKKARRRGIDISRVVSQDELFDRESGRRASGDEP